MDDREHVVENSRLTTARKKSRDFGAYFISGQGQTGVSSYRFTTFKIRKKHVIPRAKAKQKALGSAIPIDPF